MDENSRATTVPPGGVDGSATTILVSLPGYDLQAVRKCSPQLANIE